VLTVPQSRLSRYGTALFTILAALALRWSLWPFLGPELPFLLLWPAVLVAAWLGGLGPGLLATALAVVVEDFLLIQPDSLLTGRPAELVGIALFGLLGALTTVLTDWTRRARSLALEHAREAERRREWLRVVLASIGDAVIATDGAGHVAFMNVVAQALTGWKEDEALGQRLDKVFCVLDRDSGARLNCPVRQALRHGAAVCLAGRLHLVARAGTLTPVECTASPIRDAAGGVLGVVLTFRDFSQQTRLEAELRQRAEELAEADRQKDRFLAMLAHELRNPLAPVRNAARLLGAEGPPDERTRWAAAVIERQVGQMTRLVEDLLDVARVRQGKVRLRPEPVEVRDVVERAVESCQPLLQARMQELAESLPAEPVWLEGDPVRLAQVVANLLHNASKYTEERGHISLAAAREGPAVVLRVRDTGAGIPPEMLSRIFNLFTQVEGTVDRSQGGLGIGLTLVRDLVRLHGGTVEALSDGPGAGSEFVVRLPALEGVVVPLPRASAAAPPGRRQGQGPAGRVLVVEDNRDAAESLARLLRAAGHEVRTAYDGPAALAEARAFQPQVVFSDIDLPGMDGYEVARRLRQEYGPVGPLLVAVTGLGQEGDRRRALEAGFDDFLVKPVDPDALQRLLGRPAGPPPGPPADSSWELDVPTTSAATRAAGPTTTSTPAG
jgi:PAS domain S-box-containing protein